MTVNGNSDTAITNSTGALCMLGEENGATSNCVIGAVTAIINYDASDEQAKALCESLKADLRTVCFQEAEEHHKSLQT
jgi:hypothetical protein